MMEEEKRVVKPLMPSSTTDDEKIVEKPPPIPYRKTIGKPPIPSSNSDDENRVEKNDKTIEKPPTSSSTRDIKTVDKTSSDDRKIVKKPSSDDDKTVEKTSTPSATGDAEVPAKVSLCSICQQRQKSSVPEIWCPDCAELLCTPCQEHHKLSKGTKDHQVIPFQDYQKLPPIIIDTELYCSDHGYKFSEFCCKHDIPICVKCRKEFHKKCEDVPMLDDVIHNVKESVAFENTITDLETLCKNLKEIARDRNDNLQQLNTMQQEIKALFEEKFDKIINHLNQLKKEGLSEIDSSCNELLADISNTSQTVQFQDAKFQGILDQLENIRGYASDLQTFMGIKKLETMIHEENININQLSQNHKLDKNQIKFDTNKAVEDILHSIQSLVDFRVIKSPPAVSICTSRPQEAQKKVQVREKIPAPVKLHIEHEVNLYLDLNCNHYFCTLPNGLMVFTDGNELLIYKLDGTLKSRISMPWDINDLTLVDDHHLAVSDFDNHISIIAIDKSIIKKKTKIVKTLQIGEKVYGLCCMGRFLVCCVSGKGLIRVNIDSGKVKMVVKDESVSDRSHVGVSNSLIFYTCPDTDTVTILDTQYKVIFTNKVDIRPKRVAIDDLGYIYVTCQWSHCIVLFSPDGKTHHELLSVETPTDVHFDSSSKKLMVLAPYDYSIYIYSIEYV